MRLHSNIDTQQIVCVCAHVCVCACVRTCVCARVCVQVTVKYDLIGASLSEPHTYVKYATAVCMCIYIYVPYVMPYSSIYSFTMAAASEPL